MSVICKNCSNEIGESVKFCPYCGTKVEAERENTFDVAKEESFASVESTLPNEAEAVSEVQPEDASYEMPTNEPEFVPEPKEESVNDADVKKADDGFVMPEPKVAPVYEEPAQQPQMPQQTPVNAPSFAQNSTAFVQNPTAPTNIQNPVPTMTKQAVKQAERMAKEKAKQEEKARKLAEKSLKKNAKAEKEVHTPDVEEVKKEKKARKVTTLGVVCTVFLTLLLIVNVCLCYGLALGVGVTKSVEFDKDDKAFNSDTETLGEMWDEIKQDGNVLTVATQNNEYSIDLSDDMIDALSTFSATKDGKNAFVENIEKSLDVIGIVLMGSAGYVALVIFIIICAIYVSLGNSRRTFIIPGTIFSIFGLLALVCAVIGAVSPTVFGVSAVETLFGFDAFATFALIGAAATAILGVIFIAVGASGKEK